MNSLLSILAVFSAIAGILLLWLVLRKFFTISVSLVTVILVVFGTNYFRWIFFDGATPHNFLFTLFAAVILFTINWQNDRKWLWLILMLPVVVLACFIHDLSVFILFVPLLWGIYDRTSWLATRMRIMEQPQQYLFLLLIVALAFGLTRFAWFAEPGTAFYFGDKEASVYPWLAANFQLILFSFNKGWFIYTPMMMLVFPGLYLLAERNRTIFFGLFFFFLFWFLLAASHPMWNAGAGFGQRFFIETYAVLALPLGYLVQWILQRKPWIRICLLILPTFFLLLNLFQTWQYTKKIIVAENMNQEYYRMVFGKTTADTSAQKLMVKYRNPTPETRPAVGNYKVTKIEGWDYEVPIPGHEPFYNCNIAHTGKRSWRTSKEKRFSPGVNRKIRELSPHDTVWIRVTAWLYFTCHKAENCVNLVIFCNHSGAFYKYLTNNYSDKLETGVWNKVTCDYQLPGHLQGPDDELNVYFWNYGERETLLDDFTVELFEPEPGK
jgi:hypothetical protein